MNVKSYLLYVLLYLFGSYSVYANGFYLPTEAGQLGKSIIDEMIKVDNAQVAYANFEALRRDFLHLKDKSNNEIEDWILEHFAYVSKQQLKMDNIKNTPIPVVEGKVVPGFRGKFDGRNASLEVKDDEGHVIGIVDLKGIGMLDFMVNTEKEEYEKIANDLEKLNAYLIKPYKNGLMTFGEAIAELTRQFASQRIFDIANQKNPGIQHQTIETYFIIALPFNILRNNNSSDPAAIYGRQGHIGRDMSSISTHEHTDVSQKDFFGSKGDFGAVHIFHPDLLKTFGEPSEEKAWLYGHEVARAFLRPENPDKEVIYRHLETMLSPIVSEWDQIKDSIHNPRFNFEKAFFHALQHQVQEFQSIAAHAVLLGEKNSEVIENTLSKITNSNDLRVKTSATHYVAVSPYAHVNQLLPKLLKAHMSSSDPNVREMGMYYLRNCKSDCAEAFEAAFNEPDDGIVVRQLENAIGPYSGSDLGKVISLGLSSKPLIQEVVLSALSKRFINGEQERWRQILQSLDPAHAARLAKVLTDHGGGAFEIELVELIDRFLKIPNDHKNCVFFE